MKRPCTTYSDYCRSNIYGFQSDDTFLIWHCYILSNTVIQSHFQIYAPLSSGEILYAIGNVNPNAFYNTYNLNK